MREWLLTLPCVINRKVIVDVRGPHPVLIVGLIASAVETKDDVYMFIALSLPIEDYYIETETNHD